MPPRINKLLVTTGVITLIQAAVQSLFAAFAIAQYFCVIDFLRRYPILIFIRILYFHNPKDCGSSVYIGESINGIPNQAFVLVQNEPFTTTRTFILSCVSLGLSILWVIGSILLIKGGMKRYRENASYWPWLVITLAITIVDFFAIITYANDSFHTKTLDEIMHYINGTANGTLNVVINTTLASWAMVLVFARFIVFLLVNMGLMTCAIVDCTRSQSSEPSPELERTQNLSQDASEIVSDDTTSSPSMQGTKIPRPGLSQSFRTMKDFLFNRNSHRPGSGRTSLQDRNRQRTVNFPEKNQRSLESMVMEQQHRLNLAIIERTRRGSPDQRSRRLASSYSYHSPPETSPSRRDTDTKPQGQMPWSYIPAPANRMRDQLPPDEDLPPVPLPDYTAFQSARKASVHRAASSLSSLTQKKDTSYQSTHQVGRNVDVLY